MSDDKLTLDLGMFDNEPEDPSKKGEATVPSDSGSQAHSGNTKPGLLDDPIQTLNLTDNQPSLEVSDLGNLAESTSDTLSLSDNEVPPTEPIPASSNEEDGFVPVNLDALPEQPVGSESGTSVSEADFWDGAGELFTNAGTESSATNLQEAAGIEVQMASERRKKLLGIGLVVALLGGVVVMEPDLVSGLLDDVISSSDTTYEEPSDLALVSEDDLLETATENEEPQEDLTAAVGNGEAVAANDAEIEAGEQDADTLENGAMDGLFEEEVATTNQAGEEGVYEIDWRENPYWHLPNHFSETVEKPTETWTVEQEEAWRENLESKFIWQKYKVLGEIKDAKLLGSEILLWDLAKEKKLWLRLKALMALADFGEKVSMKDVLDAVEGVRPSTLASFVKRFKSKSSVGERFVLRQLVRVMDTNGRFQVLRVLDKQRDKYSDLYLSAGALDPDERVSKWAKRRVNKLEEKVAVRLDAVVKGKAEFEDETLLLDQQAEQEAKTEKNLFGGMVDNVAEREKQKLEEESAQGNLVAQDALEEEVTEEFEQDVDPEEVMIYE